MQLYIFNIEWDSQYLVWLTMYDQEGTVYAKISYVYSLYNMSIQVHDARTTVKQS